MSSIVDTFLQKSEDFASYLDSFIEEAQSAQALFANIQRAQEISQQQETALQSKRADLLELERKNQKDSKTIGEKLASLERKQVSLEKTEQQIDVQRKSYREELRLLEEKKADAALLEKRAQEIQLMQRELDTREQALVQREGNIAKKELIDEKRKEMLDISERELAKEKERIAKYLNIA